jgi:exodeoxyribonuclease VII large subunit
MAKKIITDEPNQLAFSDFTFDDATGDIVEHPKNKDSTRTLTRLSPDEIEAAIAGGTPAGAAGEERDVSDGEEHVPSWRTKKRQPARKRNTVMEPPDQPLVDSDRVYRVGEFLDVVNTSLKSLRTTVQGEVSQVQARGGAIYFTLSDKQEKAVLSCFVWRNRMATFGFDLEEGMEIQIVGSPNIYKPFGKFSFDAHYISPVGEGALKLALERLRKELEAKGYFDPERKRPIPRYATTIGLVTSEFGDARKDFLTHLGNHGLDIRFYDVRVEGVRSIASIVRALRWFNTHAPDVEVIVLTRGGGSLESLQSFNSVEVAEAIFTSRIPVVCAVGHENDVSIADMVADLRASTPTDAGKILGRHWADATDYIESVAYTISTHFRIATRAFEDRLRITGERILNRYERILTERRHRISVIGSALLSHFRTALTSFDRLEDQFSDSAAGWYRRLDTHLARLEERLDLVDPARILKQGYSIAYNKDGSVITHASDAVPGDELNVQVSDGIIHSTVTE